MMKPALALLARDRRAERLAVLCAVTAALALPVVISTAGAFETESFVVVYLLAAALASDPSVKARSGQN